MTEREVSSERVSEERLGHIATDKDNFYRPEIKAMAQELLALRSSVKTVGVKKLEWDESSGHGVDPYDWSIGAKTQTLNYRINWEGYGKGHTNHVGPYFLERVGKAFLSIEEAKAAAQADYEQRILSAIEAPSEGEGVDEVHWIDELRKKAFRTNAPEDRTAYFEACSKWFQDRHYRRISPSPAAPSEVTEERDALLDYILQDDLQNRLTPRIVDIAYTAFTLAKAPNVEDGGPSDWFTDTKPLVNKLIEQVRADLTAALKGDRP